MPPCRSSWRCSPHARRPINMPVLVAPLSPCWSSWRCGSHAEGGGLVGRSALYADGCIAATLDRAEVWRSLSRCCGLFGGTITIRRAAWKRLVDVGPIARSGSFRCWFTTVAHLARATHEHSVFLSSPLYEIVCPVHAVVLPAGVLYVHVGPKDRTPKLMYAEIIRSRSPMRCT